MKSQFCDGTIPQNKCLCGKFHNYITCDANFALCYSALVRLKLCLTVKKFKPIALPIIEFV